VGIVGGKGIVCLLVFMKEYRIAMLFLGRSLSGKDSRLDGLHLANNGWTHKFGTGQYIRDNIGSGINTEIGLSAAPKHDNGELVDDSIIEAIWNQGIGELVSRSSPPLLLSGCVRNKKQAEAFPKFLEEKKYLLSLVCIETSEDECLRRIDDEVRSDSDRKVRKDTAFLRNKVKSDGPGFTDSWNFFTGEGSEALIEPPLVLKGMNLNEDMEVLFPWAESLLLPSMTQTSRKK